VPILEWLCTLPTHPGVDSGHSKMVVLTRSMTMHTSNMLWCLEVTFWTAVYNSSMLWSLEANMQHNRAFPSTPWHLRNKKNISKFSTPVLIVIKALG